MTTMKLLRKILTVIIIGCDWSEKNKLIVKIAVEMIAIMTVEVVILI